MKVTDGVWRVSFVVNHNVTVSPVFASVVDAVLLDVIMVVRTEGFVLSKRTNENVVLAVVVNWEVVVDIPYTLSLGYPILNVTRPSDQPLDGVVVEYVQTVALVVATLYANMVVEPIPKILITGVLVANASPPLLKSS